MAFTQTGVPMPALVPDSGTSAPATASFAAPTQVAVQAADMPAGAPAVSFSAPSLHVETAPVASVVPLLATPSFDSGGTVVLTQVAGTAAALSTGESGIAPLSHAATFELPFTSEAASGDGSSDLGGPAPLIVVSDLGDASDVSGWFVV